MWYLAWSMMVNLDCWLEQIRILGDQYCMSLSGIQETYHDGSSELGGWISNLLALLESDERQEAGPS